MASSIRFIREEDHSIRALNTPGKRVAEYTYRYGQQDYSVSCIKDPTRVLVTVHPYWGAFIATRTGRIVAATTCKWGTWDDMSPEEFKRIFPIIERITMAAYRRFMKK